MCEVCVTGVGLIAGHLTSPDALFEHIGTGRSLVRDRPRQRAHGLRNSASARVEECAWDEVERQLPSDKHRLGPAARLAWFAAGQAWGMSGLPDRLYSARGGVFCACNKYELEVELLERMAGYCDFASNRFDLDAYLERGGHEPHRHYRRLQDGAALSLAQHYALGDVVMNHGDACASGGMAIGSAYRHIRHGELDVALAGGAESMCDVISHISFSALGALATDGPEDRTAFSRPFDKQRRGFVMGEGSAFLVLESREHAQARGARILAYVAGYSAVAEGGRMTASEADGSEYARCITGALADAGLGPEHIDHINAHGTSTVANDACEAAAIRRVFGARAAQVPVTANKSAMGHSLASSGASEAVLSVLSLVQQEVLPTLNFEAAGPDCVGLNILTQRRPTRLEHILSTSFGFGGENCALILRAAPSCHEGNA